MDKELLKEIVTIRISQNEKDRLKKAAEITASSLSEFVRKKALGYPIKSKIDFTLINELRRQGGLIKNNFNTIRDMKNIDTREIIILQESLLSDIKNLINKVSKSYESNYDNEENSKKRNEK